LNAAVPQQRDTIRLFFALWPDAQVRARLDGWAAALHADCGGRRMRAENLHLTLAFLGATGAARLEQLKHLAAQVSVTAFDLQIDQPGYWKHNRIAWAGASVIPEPLAALIADLRDELTAGGFRFDPKPFVPHVTLLREAREPQPLPQFPAIAWPVSGLALVRSVPGGQGVRYVVEAARPGRTVK